MNENNGSLSIEDLNFIYKQSSKNKKNSVIYSKRGIVIFVDVLGWKNSANDQTIIKLMELTNWLKWKILDTQLRFIKLEDYKNNVDIINLSDTIVILIDMKDGPYFWANIFNDISEFVCKALFEYKLLFRGALGYGDFIINKGKSMFVGQVINEVAELYESASWANILISDTFIKEFLSKNSKNNLVKIGIKKYDQIPYKEKNKHNEKYVLYPYERVWKNQNGTEAIKILETMNISNDNHIRNIFCNTIKFIQYIEEQKNEYNT